MAAYYLPDRAADRLREMAEAQSCTDEDCLRDLVDAAYADWRMAEGLRKRIETLEAAPSITRKEQRDLERARMQLAQVRVRHT